MLGIVLEDENHDKYVQTIAGNGAASGSVTSDGQSTVTSQGIYNAISASNSFSTTETVTTGKWVDNKPIYRKVVVLNSPTISSNKILFDPGMTNLDVLVSATGTFKYANSTVRGVIGKEVDNNYSVVFDEIKPDAVSIWLSTSQSSGAAFEYFICIFEYTKTTD